MADLNKSRIKPKKKWDEMCFNCKHWLRKKKSKIGICSNKNKEHEGFTTINAGCDLYERR